MQITDALLTISNYNRPGTKRTRMTAIACHYIGNPGTSAKANRNWFESLSKTHETKASCHYIIGLRGEILRLIPEEEISWCTNQANGYTISIEACHHDVTGKVCPKWFVDHPEDWETFKWDVMCAMTQVTTVGWIQDSVGWWYRHHDGSYTTNGWEEIAGKWYWFDGAGYAAESTWYDYKDRWYYLGEDCAMVTGLRIIDSKIYYFEPSGAMSTKPVTLVPDKDRALR